MNKPTKILSDGHQNILKVIETLDRECNALESSHNLDKPFFEKAVDFIQNYADKFHHAKEEDILLHRDMQRFGSNALQPNSTNASRT